MAKPDLGSKRQCQECDAKFFDFNKAQILCPKCGAAFKARAFTRAAAIKDDDESDLPEVSAETVSLEDADTGDKVSVVVDDLGDEGDADDADDAFLEDDEEDGADVIALIDGDIATDEEV